MGTASLSPKIIKSFPAYLLSSNTWMKDALRERTWERSAEQGSRPINAALSFSRVSFKDERSRVEG